MPPRSLQTSEPSEGLPVVYVRPSKYGLVPWCAQLQSDLYQLGMRDDWNNTAAMVALGLTAWKTRVRAAVLRREQCRWWDAVNASPMLRTYVHLKSGPESLQRELYLSVRHGGWNDQRLAGRRLLIRLRSGQNELRVNTGRWESLPRQLRLCELCAEEVEDEAHFLMRCPFFAIQRASLLSGLDSILHEAYHGGLMPVLLRCADLNSASLLTLLLGGRHSSITATALQHRILAHIMCHIPAWIEARKERLEMFAEIAESLDC